MKEKKNKKYNKRKSKLSIYNDIKCLISDYDLERQIINSKSYCPCEYCDGFLPVFLIDDVPNDLLNYVKC
jgi:hypothetical protein